ncbi:capsular biosynthesis protein [Legionella taurinensis]|uniref:Capsular biosynthesis protein n=1 Tax=Legionella taurinensis TaxID=70611 RepID=A0A3A5LD85_9GAMM|nr:HAD hydrolase family protein [Legionella taurinensis]MDX1838623.1 HAD hydrolase family protein [Legionella taurinensis]PUT39059.1 capsular biosynthesis protein [Legionella taurinensis]PUT41146.1 capsular biosynthesis protein [Legionella taurinensis]PUT43521.1 capsular biosynthesis protein [Legionella taurinensis]PUT46538.1 capsular biosynthesis protein [Legionella taurinensis]
MRICIDIDGTICTLRQAHETYQDVQPLEGAAERIKALKDRGFYIILCTARHMKTCESNVGRVVAKEGLTLLEWLKNHGFVYDEIWFGKPYAQVYIDDRALQFKGSWQHIEDDLINSYL